MFVHLLLSILVIEVIARCPIDIQQIPSTMSCINVLQCYQNQNQSIMVYQNCNMKFYMVINTNIGDYSHQQITQINWTRTKANKIKMNDKFMVINYGIYASIYYNFSNKKFNYFVYNCAVLDYQVLNRHDSGYQLISLCQNQIVYHIFNSLAISSHTDYHLNYSLSSLQCIDNASICLLGTKNGELLYYNYMNNQVQFLQHVQEGISIAKIVYKQSNNKIKTFISSINGMIYELIIQNNQFIMERKCIKFINQSIHELKLSQDGNYLIVTDDKANLTQININNGILLDDVNLDMYMPQKSSLKLEIVFINQSTYIIYNSLNRLMLVASINHHNISNQNYLVCSNMKYYNSTNQQCISCSSNCSSCNPIDGSCYECIQGFFNKQGKCLNCYYDAQGLTSHFQQCFTQSQKNIIDASSTAINFLSHSVSTFSNFVNLIGVLFIFMKVINNWNIISLYLYLPIPNIPFFLSNILITIYNNFNASILSFFKVQTDFAYNIKNGFQDDKYEFTNRTTDFMKQNGQNIILFIYSVILIMTLFRFINYIFSRYDYQIFDHNHYFAILDQFIGSFTTSLVPFFTIFKLKCSTPMDKFNTFCFYNLFGLAILAPFFLLIVTQEQNKARKNKIANLDDLAAIQLIQRLKLKRQIKLFRHDTNIQSFLYAILSFSIAILAPYQSPIPFFIIISVIHIASIVYAFYCNNRLVNNIIQKVNGFMFHICFILFYIIEDRNLEFYIALAIVVIMIFGTVHEIVVGVFRKIQLICLLIQAKIEKDKKIKQFLQGQKDKEGRMKRQHPKDLKDFKMSPTVHQTNLTKKYKGKVNKNVSFDNVVQNQSSAKTFYKNNKVSPINSKKEIPRYVEGDFQLNFGFKTDKSIKKSQSIQQKVKFKLRGKSCKKN